MTCDGPFGAFAFGVEKKACKPEKQKASTFVLTFFCLVPRRGLEPPRSYPLVPETSASTNSATWALLQSINCRKDCDYSIKFLECNSCDWAPLDAPCRLPRRPLRSGAGAGWSAQAKKKASAKALAFSIWCPREDSNLHGGTR